MNLRRPKHTRFILSSSAAAFMALASSSFAVENIWTGALNNDWNNAGNWSLGRVPTNTNGEPVGDPFDDAVINSLTNFPVITVDLSATPRDIVVGGILGTTGRVDHVSGLAATGGGNWMFVGRDGGSGTYNLANTALPGGTLTGFGEGSGSLNVGGRLYVGGFNGATIGSVGSFIMNTVGMLTVGNDLAIGSAGGTGVMTVDAGTITTGGWNFIGKNEGAAGGNGTLRMSGGTLTNNGARTFIGLGDSTGSLQMSGGVYNNVAPGDDNFFAIGVNNLGNPTTPTLNMTGGTINSAHVFSIGGVEPFGGNGDANFVGSGKGSATINGATALLNSAGEFWVGQSPGSVGELNVNAGTLAVQNWIVVGRGQSTGRIAMTGGTIEKTGGGHFLVGDGPNSNGTLTQSGGNIAISTGELWVGQNTGTGLLEISGGSMTVDNWAAIGRVGGTGTMNLTGGTFTKTASTGFSAFIVADPVGSNLPTTGFVNQSGDTSLTTNEIWVGQGNGGNGTYSISGGTMTSSSWIAVGRESGIGTVNISGTGVVKKVGGAGSHIIIGSLGGTGVVNQTGGQLLTEGGGDILLGEQGANPGSGTWNILGGTGTAQSLRIGWLNRPGNVTIAGDGVVTMVNTPGNDDTGRVTVSQSAGDGTLGVHENGSLFADHINVGSGTGKGIVAQTGGTVTANRWIAVGIGSTQQAEYNLSGGTTNAAGFEVADTQGIVRISGSGILNVSGNIEVPSRNGIGVIDITGGTINTVNYLQGGRDGNTLGSGVTNQSSGVVNVSGDLVVQRPGVGLGAYNLSGGTLAVNGSIQGSLGSFTFTGGEITRSTPGIITFNGDLTTGAGVATLGLDGDKTFQINGALNNVAGLTLDLTGLGLPDQPSPLLTPVTGSFALGNVTTVPAPGSFNIGQTFDLGFDGTFLSGAGSFTALRINEDAPFDAMTQSVYWLDEDGGVVTLQYSLIPEPSSALMASLSGFLLAGRRRRRH
jgi:hypothetical protein